MINSNPEAKFGFTRFAEIWNGRLAMVGFFSLLIDVSTGQGLLGRLGLL